MTTHLGNLKEEVYNYCLSCTKMVMSRKEKLEKGRIYSIDWRKRNPDKVKAYAKMRYQRDKKEIKKNTEKWRQENPKRWAELSKKARDRFDYKKNHKGAKKKYYESHKSNIFSAMITNAIVKGKNKFKAIKLDKKFFLCKRCGSKDSEIHHEIYPRTKKEIVKAIEDGKIYSLCDRHHKDIHIEMRRKLKEEVTC